MEHEALITRFYTAFANGDSAGMAACYHPDITFNDPAFGTLNGSKASLMWEMLLSNTSASPQIEFYDISANKETGTAGWTARYVFGPKRREVVNVIKANFRFKEGLIYDHKDSFNLWKWSRQALGLPGLLMGWTPFMAKQIRQRSTKALDSFIAKKEA